MAEDGSTRTAWKFSRNAIRELDPHDKTYEVRDPNRRGLILRVHPSGQKVWMCEFARARKIKIGDYDTWDTSHAWDKAKEIRRAYEYEGVDPVKERRKPKAQTLRSFLDGEYGDWSEEHYSRGRAESRRMKANFPDLLDKPLGEIMPLDVERWRVRQSKAGVPASTLNRQVAPLKALMKRAAEWGIIPTDPLAGAVRPRKVDSAARVRYLSADEETRLRDALGARDARLREARSSANQWRLQRGYRVLPSLEGKYGDHLFPLVLLSFHTGIRQGEAFNLQWSDVNLELESPTLTVRGEGAKSGQTRHIPLNAEAVQVLKLWRGRSTKPGFVFPGKDGNRLTTVKTAWSKLMKDASIASFRFHDLRHTFASNLVMAGVDLNTVRELLGHADLKMTLRYAHLAPHVKADAVSRLPQGGGGEVVEIGSASR